jgi:hypothetical protein
MSSSPVRASFVLASAAMLAIAGCGKTESKPAPTTNTPVKESSTAIMSVAQSTKAATDAILGGATGSAVSTSSARAEAAAPFSFTASGEFDVDFDMKGGDGKDAFPDATGIMHVKYDGSAVGSSPAGSGGVAGWNVAVTFPTDVVYTDPQSHNVSTMAAGSMIGYKLNVSWNRVDDQNWNVQTSYDVPASTGNIDLNMSLLADGETTTAHVVGNQHIDASATAVGGSVIVTYAVQEHWETTVSKNGATQTVIWDRPSTDSITLTVNGVVSGPFTRAQLLSKHAVVVF